MTTFFNTGRVIPFTETLDFGPLTTTNAPQVLLETAAYDVLWAELEATVEDYSVDISIVPDAIVTVPIIATAEDVIGDVQLWGLVNGVPVNVGRNMGSHSLLITVTSHTLGEHGVVEGRIRLHGFRRS